MRKAKPKKRILLPDPKFNDVLVTRFVNNLMVDGKKSIAYTIFYDALDIVGEKMKDADKAPLEIWKQALENITPQVEVKSRRIGGATFQVPTEVRPERKISLSMKNLVLYSRKRAGKSMAEKLSAEIIAAYNQEGAAFKRKEEMHRANPVCADGCADRVSVRPHLQSHGALRRPDNLFLWRCPSHPPIRRRQWNPP